MRGGDRCAVQIGGVRGVGYYYIDEVMLDLTEHATPHNGPIPRYY